LINPTRFPGDYEAGPLCDGIAYTASYEEMVERHALFHKPPSSCGEIISVMPIGDDLTTTRSVQKHQRPD